MRWRRRSDKDFAGEIEAHLQIETDRLIAEGMVPEEARKTARRVFGNTTLARERFHEGQRLAWIEGPRRDVRYALRSLRRSPAFATVAVLTLALGIGANTAIFSAVDAVLLQPPDLPAPDRVVRVGAARATNLTPRPGIAAPQDYLDWRARQTVFEGLAAYTNDSFTYQDVGREPEVVRGSRVSSDFFAVARIAPAAGRLIGADDEQRGDMRIAVLNPEFWRSHFGESPDVIGRTVLLDGEPYEVVGISAASLNLGPGAPDVWVPLVIPDSDRIRRVTSFNAYIRALARLRDGVSLDEASAQMEQIALALEQEHPIWNEGRRVSVITLQDSLIGGDVRSWMWLLFAGAALVLLIVVANIASLSMARAVDRAPEIGVRIALGAGRWQMVRGLLVESLLVAVCGTMAGVVLAWWGVDALRAAFQAAVPRAADMRLDLRLLGASAAVGVTTGIAFGLVPAMRASRANTVRAIKTASETTTLDRSTQRLRGALVAAEIAFSTVLLVAAGLFLASLVNVSQLDLGYRTDSIFTTELDLANVPDGPERWAQVAEIVALLEQHPENEAVAAISNTVPFRTTSFSRSFRRPNVPIEPGRMQSSYYSQVTADYHRVMGIPLLAGRLFTSDDRDEAPPVMLIDETAASTLFPGENPVGQFLDMAGTREIVGVVGAVRHGFSEGAEPRPAAYLPIQQGEPGRSPAAHLVVRTASDPWEAMPTVRAAVFATWSDVPLRNVSTVADLAAEAHAPLRLGTRLMSLFGALGLLISAVGIYGVVAYAVSRRRREIAIRIALGATAGRVIRLIAHHSAVLAIVGVIVGGIAAWTLAGTTEPLLFQLDPTDVRVFGAALGVPLAVSILAGVVSARRAAAVDPLAVLKAD